jgi:hypothetical protein
MYFGLLLILRGPAVLERTLAASHERFLNLFRHLVGLFWKSDQTFAKVFTYKGQHKTER